MVVHTEHCLGWRCDDDSMGPDSPIVEYNKYLISGFKAMGTSPENNASDYKRMLEEAGFTDVQTYEYKVSTVYTILAPYRTHVSFPHTCWI